MAAQLAILVMIAAAAPTLTIVVLANISAAQPVVDTVSFISTQMQVMILFAVLVTS